MVVLAGLPPEHHTWAVDLLGSKARVVVGAPPSARDGALYPARVIETLFEVCRVVRGTQAVAGAGQPDPPEFRDAAVRHVPRPGGAPVGVRLRGAARSPGPPRRLRRDGPHAQAQTEAVEAALGDVFAPGARANAIAGEVRQRVGRRSEADALLLPSRNFRVDGGDLTAMFREYRSDPPESPRTGSPNWASSL